MKLFCTVESGEYLLWLVVTHTPYALRCTFDTHEGAIKFGENLVTKFSQEGIALEHSELYSPVEPYLNGI